MTIRNNLKMKKLTLIILLTSFTLFGQKKINQTELVKDLTIWKKQNNKMSGTLWIPNSYWKIALEGNTNIPKNTIEMLEKAFEDYVLICIVDIKIGARGNMTFKTKTELGESLSLIDSNNKEYNFLNESEISYNTKSLLKNITPMFSQMFGKMGKGMHLFLFKVKNNKGENIINEFKKGSFIVKHSQNKFNWNLPLSSLIDKKKCPVDNNEMNGNWNFCPFHGKELVAK